MNNTAPVFFAGGVMSLMTTIAQFNGHVTDVAFYQILGSIIGTVILTVMFAKFK